MFKHFDAESQTALVKQCAASEAYRNNPTCNRTRRAHA